MKLLYSTNNNSLYKLGLIVTLLLVLQGQMMAQSCSPAVAAPTLSTNTQPLLCPALTADLSNLITSTAPNGMILEWHSVASNPTPANLVSMPVSATGTFYAYYYHVDNNCYSVASAAVTVTNTAIASPTATVSNNTLCEGTNGAITFTAPTPLSNYEFAIDGGGFYQSSPTFTGLAAGSYDIIVRSLATGCESAIVSKTITNSPAVVTAPTATVTNVTNCINPNGVITVTAPTPLSSYQFSIDGLNFQDDPIFDGLAGGSYSVYSKSLATGCVSAATAKTLTTPTVTAPTTTLVNPTSCITGNGTITFTAPTPLTNYQFSIDGGQIYQASTSFTGLISGGYDTRVKLISSGCESAIVVKTLTDPVVTAPTTTVVNNSLCVGSNGSITFTAPTPLANYQFSIDGGDSYQVGTSFTGLAANTYATRVKLISSGCESAIVNKAMTDAPVAVTAPTATVVNPTDCNTPNGTITVTAPTPLSNYEFSIDGGTIYQSGTVFSGLKAGAYSVMSRLISTGCESAATAKTLTNPTVTAATATAVNNTSCISPNGSITVTAPTPLANYQFSIDDGGTYQTSNVFSNLSANAYGVVVKLITSGCESATVVKTITDAPVAVAAPTVTIGTVTNCNTPNGSLTITAPTPLANYQFSVDGGFTYQAGNIFSNLDIGSYDVVAKLISTGCESPIATKVITSTAVTAPTTTIVNNTNCANPNGTITVTAPTPLANYEFSIDGGTTYQTSAVFTGLAGGSYNAVSRLISTGCESALSAKTVTDAPAAITSPTTTLTQPTSCSPANGAITFTAPTPLANYEFSVDGGLTYQSSANFTGLAPGTYNTRIRAIATGCESASVAKILTSPAVTAPTTTLVNNTSCGVTPNGSITFTAPTPLANYEFSIDSGRIYQSSNVFSGLTGGSYDARVRLVSTGCAAAAVTKTLLNSTVTPATPTATVVNVTDCNANNGSITFLTPTPLANYEFSINGGTTYQSSAVFSNLTAGAYSLKVRSLATYCASAVAAKTITNPTVTAPTATVSNPTSCSTPNGLITVTAPTPLSNYEFSIDGGTTFQASANFTNLAGGSYNVVAKLVSSGCKSAAVAKTLTNPAVTAPTVTLTNNTTCLTPNGAIRFTAPTPLSNYNFSIDGGNNFQTNADFLGLAAGSSYSVVIKSTVTGCKSTPVAKTLTNAASAVPVVAATQVNVTNCNTPNGSITFTAPTPLSSYQFSIDSGRTFQASHVFTNLTAGTYYLRAKSIATGCIGAALVKTLTNATVTVPTATVINNTSCATPNGKITISAPTPLGNYQFSINGGTSFQASNEFLNLNGGAYSVVAKLISSGCKSTAVAKTITNPTIPIHYVTLTNNTDCNSPNGKIAFYSPTPLTNYTYSIDSGKTYQSNINFTGLNGGTYYSRIKSVLNGCESAVTVRTLTSPVATSPTVTVVNSTNCATPNGKLTFTAPTPLANYTFSIDSGKTFQAATVYPNLSDGSYYVQAKLSSTGCKSAIVTKTITKPTVTVPVPTGTSIENTCPATSVSLLKVQPVAAANTMLEWHTGTTPTAGNLVAAPTNVSAAGNYYLFAQSNINSCYSVASTVVTVKKNDCTDTDNDGIPDYFDIDDDNDGVLDADEAVSCQADYWSYANFVLTTNKYSGDLLKNGVKVANVSFEIPAGQSGYTTQPTGTAQSATRVTFVTLQSVIGGDHYFQIKIAPLPGVTINAPFRIIQPGYAPVWVNHPGQHYANLGNKLNGSPSVGIYTERVEHVTERSGVTYYYTGERLTNPAFAPDGAGYMDLIVEADYAHPYVYEYHQVDIYNNSFINERVNIDVPQCLGDPIADSDGDGIPNSKDLDSDNDGCSDAFEAGMTTNQTANYQFTGKVGTNGYIDYLETSWDNGTPVIAHTYPNAIDSIIHKCILPCNAGKIAPNVPSAVKTVCPSPTINLNTITASNMPITGSTVILTWHTGSPATDANKLTPAQAAAAPAGIYYASFYDVGAGCYSGETYTGTATTKVTITACVPCLQFSAGGTTATATPTVCGTPNSVTIDLSNEVGSVVKWQTSTNSGTSWTDIAETNTSLTYNNVVNNQFFRAVVNSGGTCVDAESSITVVAVSAAPIISGVSKTDATVMSCPAVNDGSITVSASGLRLQYSINNGTTWQASNIFSGLTAGSYTVKVRDSVSLCVIDYTSNPVVISSPSCPVGIYATLTCDEIASARLYVSAPDIVNETYTWRLPSGVTLNSTSTGDTSILINASAAVRNTPLSIWLITTRLSSGCKDSIRLYLTVPDCPEVCNDGIDNDGDSAIDCADTDCAIPSLTISNTRPTTFCQGDSTTLSVTAVAGATYAWSNSANTSSILVTTGGNYSVTVTKNGCTNTASKAVTVNQAPAAPSVASAVITGCAGGTTTLTASGAVGATFLWRKPDGSTAATNPLSIANTQVTDAGIYSVKQTVSGCTSTDSTKVTVVVQSCGMVIACADISNVKIGIDTNAVQAGTTFSWVIPSGITRLNAVATPDTLIRLNFAGQPLGVAYPVKLVVTKGSCTDTALYMITLPSTCAEICNNGVDDDSDGKTDCADSDCITQAGLTLDASTPNPFICTGDSVILKAPVFAGATYLWSNGKTTDTIHVKASGTYTVSVTANTCTKTSSQKVTVSNCETELTCTEIQNVKFRVPNPDVANETYAWILPTGVSKLTGSALDTTINVRWDTTNVALPAGQDHPLKLVITNKASGCKDTTLINVYIPRCGEICNDGIDNDNDGMTDCLDPECNLLPRTVVVGGIDGNGNTMCLGDSMRLAVANVPLSTTYRWATPTGDTLTSTTIFAKTGGTYYVTVTANSCAKTANVKVKVFQCTDILTCDEVNDATFKVPVPADPSVESYSWILPTGATLISSSARDTVIHVNLANTTRNQSHPIKLVSRNLTCTPNCLDTTTLSVFVPKCGENCTNGIDDDQDGYTDCEDTECQPILNNSGITSTPITQASCPYKNNGTITLTTSQGTGLQYSKDNGTTWQSSNVFTGLTAGDYQIKIKNAQGCEALNNPTITIDSISCYEICDDGIDNDGDSDIDCNDSDCKPTLVNATDSLSSKDPICGQLTSGWIMVNVENAAQISIDSGKTYIAAGDTIRNLAAGQYFIFIKTAAGCTKKVGEDNLPTITLNPAPCPEVCNDGIDNDFDSKTDCDDEDCAKPAIHAVTGTNPNICPQANNGKISVFAGGQNLEFSRNNGTTWQADSVWLNVIAGTYQIKVRNAVTGCVDSSLTPLSITAPNCVEICTDGIDNDGDGLTDCADSDCPKPVIVSVAKQSPTVCPEANNGSIVITATGTNLQYSINNGQTWQSTNAFRNLNAGIYNVKVRISGGCELIYGNNPVILSAPAQCTELCNDGIDNDGDGAIDCNDTDCGRPLITDFSRMNPACGAANSGMITVVATGVNLKYSKDSTTWQANPKFTGLAAGTYMIWVKNDSTGCTVKLTTPIILVAPNCTEVCNDGVDNDNDGLTDCDDSDCVKPTNITTTPTNPTNCALANNGQIVITATNGAQYSINGGATWQANGTFTGLTAGTYAIRVKAASGCIVSAPSVSLTSPASCTEVCDNGVDDDGDNLTDCDDPDCGKPIIAAVQIDSASNCPSRTNGKITLTVNGTNVRYSKDNGASWQTSNVFANLVAGNYTISIKNTATGCQMDTTIELLNSILPCVEICDDGIDNDGDGAADCADTDCAKPNIVVAVATNPTNCPIGDNGTFNVVALGSGTIAYSINNGQTWTTNGNFTNLTAGTYTVRTRLVGGCYKDTTKTLTFNAAACTEICDDGIDNDGDNAIDCNDTDCPKAIITNVTFVHPTNCPTANNGTITVTATGGTLEYSKDNGATWQSSNTFTGLRSGAYTIKARIQGQTCEAAWTFNPIILISPLNCTEICNDGIDNDGDGATDCNDTDCGKPKVSRVNTTNPSVCATLNDGKIEVIVNGANLEFSKNNGTTWQSSNLFTGLTANTYTIKVRNAVTGCDTTLSNIILSTSTTCVEICDDGIDNDGDGAADCADSDCGKPVIANVVKQNPNNCPTPNNGSITVTASPSVSGRVLEYSINGNIWQASNVFSNLSPNTYTVRIREIGGCTEGYAANPVTLVAPAACAENCSDGIDNDGDNLIDCNDPDCGKPAIQRVDITNATCPQLNNGSITLTVAGQNLQYSKDNGTTWQVSPTFSGLSAGTYQLKAKNSVSGCEVYVGAPVSVLAPSNCNEPPAFVVTPMTVYEDSTLTICTTIYDPNPADTLTMYTYVSGMPHNGMATSSNTNSQLCYTYTPNPAYTGRDSFEITVCDGGIPEKCVTAWVPVNVIPVNDPPVAMRDVFSVSQADSLDYNLTPSVKVSGNDTDEDDAANTLTYSLLAQPTAAQGTMVFNTNGTFKFVPKPTYAGVLTLPYKVCDPHGACDIDTLEITVIDVNDAPLAVDDYVVVQRNNFVDATVLANDSDDNGLNPASVTVLKQPSKGIAVVNTTTGQIRYTPNLNKFGYDTLTYRVCDNGTPSLCDTATVYIEITTNFINQSPVLLRDSITIKEDTSNVTILILNNDYDPDGGIVNSTLGVHTPPLHGTLTMNTTTGVAIYTPAPNYFGLDSFRYRVCDNGLPTPACDSQWVWVNVTPVNDAPIAINDTISTGENQPYTGTVATNDSDIDNTANQLTYSKIGDPDANSGNWTMQPNGSFTFTPTSGFNGRDSMQYKVCDNGVPSMCDTAWVFVTVNNSNDTPSVRFLPPPVVNEDDSVTVCAFVQDPDAGDSHTVILCNTPLHGTASFTFNNTTKQLCLTYKPVHDYFGQDTVCVRVCDNGNPSLCSENKVPITVNPMPDTPTAVISPIVTPMDSTKTVCGTISDVDANQTFTATICQTPAHGTATPSVSGSQLCVQYTPTTGYLGQDSVCVRVCSNDGLCRDVKVPITVTPCPIIIDSVVAVNATCPSQRDGQIKIYASVSGGSLEYSIWNGQQWSSSNTYTRLRAGTYTIKVRRVGGCEVTYGIVTITAPSQCHEICNDGIDNDNDGLIDLQDEQDCKPKAIIIPRGN